MPALRTVDLIQPAGQSPLAVADLQTDENGVDVIDHWQVETAGGRCWTRVVLPASQTEAFTDRVNEHAGEDVRIVWTAVEATQPRPTDDADDETDEEESEASSSRVDREELYQYAQEAVGVSTVFLALVVLSTVVAAGGMLRDNVAVVIGAMVIAPLIGPNIALSLATTLGDTRLLRRATGVNLAGVGVALGFSVVLGLLIPIDPTIEEIASRTEVGIADVALALAAGAAGALSVTRGVSTALIGVMVAVALLPPLVATGLLLGAGDLPAAGNAALLTLTNVVCVNLAGVLTFLAQGVRPRRWIEVEQARASTRIAVALWVLTLAVLAAAIWLAR
jgi:uncharacterized hydrophobic protein (TIGR00341 family)